MPPDKPRVLHQHHSYSRQRARVVLPPEEQLARHSLATVMNEQCHRRGLHFATQTFSDPRARSKCVSVSRNQLPLAGLDVSEHGKPSILNSKYALVGIERFNPAGKADRTELSP